MRRIARVDANQKEIVAEFKRLGCSVLHLHQVGSGCPDLCIGYNGKTFLIEVKDGKKPLSQQKLTADEQEFKDNWKGSYHVVRRLDAVRAIIEYYS